jgi:hypothetical protein
MARTASAESCRWVGLTGSYRFASHCCCTGLRSIAHVTVAILSSRKQSSTSVTRSVCEACKVVSEVNKKGLIEYVDLLYGYATRLKTKKYSQLLSQLHTNLSLQVS